MHELWESSSHLYPGRGKKKRAEAGLGSPEDWREM